ncbi:MAG: FG-GAP repeat protein, partial [Candidatus Omnitrophica bacterium]|nr:FG-GAP repeat protein [Candidatus Omnitrophota bacterium]
MNYATGFLRNKFIARFVILIIFLNFTIPTQAISASKANLKSFSRNAAPAKTVASEDQGQSLNKIPDSFFEDMQGDSSDGSTPLGSFTWGQEQKLLAFDSAAQDSYGYAVAISENTAVVGSPYDDDNGNNSGSVYIYTKNAGTWVYSQKIKESNAIDYFGQSVAISGDVIAVGAPLDDENGMNAGAAYIFKKNASGIWVKINKIIASDGAAGDEFGAAVSVFGDIAVVGAYLHDDTSDDCGAAYIFKENASGTSWSQVDELLANDGAENDYFGSSVSVFGDIAIVGAHRDDDNGSNSGSAYIFKKNASGLWPFSQKLIASDGAEGDSFGFAVSVSGDKAIIGAHLDDDNGPGSGSAYVYTKNAAGVWLQANKLFASDGASEDFFGSSVSIIDGAAIVGARYHSHPESDRGAAYIFDEGLNWAETKELLASDGAQNDYFSWSVGISNDTVIVGAPRDDDNGSNSGSAYIFTSEGPAGYTVSGTILDINGNNIASAQLTKVINGTSSVINVPNGTYSFTVNHGDNVSVVPSAPGYSFPAGLADNPSWAGVVNAPVTKDFVGVLGQYDVAGTILDTNGNNIASAQLTKVINGTSSVINVPNGTYSFTVNHGDNVSVVPSAPGYSFPAGLADNPSWAGVVNAPVTKDFVGVLGQYDVVGTILDINGNNIASAQLTKVINGTSSVINVPNGAYSFTVNHGDNVSVVPSAPGYSFPAGLADNPSWAGVVNAPVTKDFVGGLG